MLIMSHAFCSLSTSPSAPSTMIPNLTRSRGFVHALRFKSMPSRDVMIIFPPFRAGVYSPCWDSSGKLLLAPRESSAGNMLGVWCCGRGLCFIAARI